MAKVINNYNYYQSSNKPLSLKENFYNNYHSLRGVSSLTSILGIFIILLLVVSLYRISVGYSVPTFTSFLELLESSPSIRIPDLTTALSESLAIADWGVFDFLRSFILVLATCLDFAIWFVNSIINLLKFLFHIVTWIFVTA